jgi:ketosteroid isomerase-like protein
MAAEDVQLVRQWIDAFNDGGFDAVVDRYWHDQIELIDPPELPDAGTHAGKAAVRERVESFLEFGWDGEFRVDELIDVGDEVVMSWRVLGRTPVGDVPLSIEVAFVLQIDDQKIRRIRQFLGKKPALEALGVD